MPFRPDRDQQRRGRQRFDTDRQIHRERMRRNRRERVVIEPTKSKRGIDRDCCQPGEPIARAVQPIADNPDGGHTAPCGIDAAG
jgi:hypothetical protein